ncbi:hypothetical protein ACFE04_021428 [Oxalis oulophora]
MLVLPRWTSRLPLLVLQSLPPLLLKLEILPSSLNVVEVASSSDPIPQVEVILEASHVPSPRAEVAIPTSPTPSPASAEVAATSAPEPPLVCVNSCISILHTGMNKIPTYCFGLTPSFPFHQMLYVQQKLDITAA